MHMRNKKHNDPVAALTENGALAHSTTSSRVLDFFTLPTRGYDSSDLIELFDKSFNENPFKCLQVLFHLRDPRNGKGEKELTLKLLQHMLIKYPKNFAANIKVLTAQYGCYKMLCELYGRDFRDRGDSASMVPLEVLADALRAGNPLSAKWAPSENGHYSRSNEGHQAKKLCNLLGLIQSNGSPDLRAYRKLITPLRTEAKIVEQLCCANRWGDINFSTVTARAMLILSKKAFPSHCADRFDAWKHAVREGRAEIKTNGIQPHEIVKSVLKDKASSDPQELQWKQMVANVKASGVLKNALAMSDVSGSMYNGHSPQAIEVSIALGIFISEVSEGRFSKKILTFSGNPEIVDVRGETLAEKVCSVGNCDGYSTNYVGALRSVLEYGKLFHVPQEMMPTAIFVLTDMEFDEADSSSSRTPHEVVRDEYNAAGYSLPKIIFWNLACRSNALPVTMRDENTALVSGFTQTLLKAFMELDPEEAFNPLTVMDNILRNYAPVVCDE